jgi:hypothetical protein
MGQKSAEMLSNMLRASAKNPIQYLDSVYLANQGSDGSRSLTLNTGIRVGDMLVAMCANRTTTAPTLLSGYTNILSINGTNSRSLRVQYKFATSTSETISWTGAYGYLMVLGDAYRIGQTNTINGTGASALTIDLPNLSGLNVSGNSFILAGSFVSSNVSSVSSPYSVLSLFAGYIEKNTNSSLTGETITLTGNTVPVTYAIEFLGA